MKSWIRNRMVIAAVALVVTAALLSIGVTALAVGEDNSGIQGLRGPTFTFGVVLGGSNGQQGDVVNGFPWAVTGYVMSKSPGSIHVWINSGSQAILDLEHERGDIITILASESQVENLNSGDWARITGFVVNGQLAFSAAVVLPGPFSY